VNPSAWVYSAMLITALAAPIMVTAMWHPRAPELTEPALRPDEIHVTDARVQQPSPLWIDAREAAIYAQGHVPGALPLNESSWDDGIAAVVAAWDPARLTIVYCDQRACQESRQVAERLRTDYQMEPVRVLHGGWAAWRAYSAR
jgi:rhodanese-related sulfurtransferase